MRILLIALFFLTACSPQPRFVEEKPSRELQRERVEQRQEEEIEEMSNVETEKLLVQEIEEEEVEVEEIERVEALVFEAPAYRSVQTATEGSLVYTTTIEYIPGQGIREIGQVLQGEGVDTERQVLYVSQDPYSESVFLLWDNEWSITPNETSFTLSHLPELLAALEESLENGELERQGVEECASTTCSVFISTDKIDAAYRIVASLETGRIYSWNVETDEGTYETTFDYSAAIDPIVIPDIQS